MENRRVLAHLGVMAAIAALSLAACGGGDSATLETEPAETSSPPTTSAPTTAAPATSTTEAGPPAEDQATTTTAAPTALEELGFPVSDDYVVETVVSGIDAATGGLALDADGFFYQADFGYAGHEGNSVLKIAPDGTVETFVQSDLMEDLTMTVLTDDGTIYQSSYGSNRVFRIDPGGNAEVIAEGLRGPTGIVVDDDGTLYVEAYNSNILHRILPDGTVEDWVFDRRFNGINGLTQGPDGMLYAADHKDGGLFSIDPDGNVEKLLHFPKPTSHLVYHDGALFVTSRGAYVVFRYELESGDVEIIAGNGEPGETDGRGAESSIGRPNAIILGPDGSFYINHGGDGTNAPLSIRRITYSP